MDLVGFFLSCVCYNLVSFCFICPLWSPAGKGLTSWLSFVVSNCKFVTFPLVSWVRCGTCLYRFLIFAPLLTLIRIHAVCPLLPSQILICLYSCRLYYSVYSCIIVLYLLLCALLKVGNNESIYTDTFLYAP